MKTRTRRSLMLAAIALSTSAQAAHAAPVTVDLRIEGKTSTLYEGRVTTDVRTFHFSGDATQARCDGTAEANGSSPIPVPTSGAALATAIDAGLSVTGTLSSWGPSFSTVSGEDVTWNDAEQTYLVEYLNGKGASVGACAQPVADGDRVLFAVASFGAPALGLQVPARVAPNEPVTAKVVDLATGAAVAGASVGGAVTGDDGTAVLGPFPTRGIQPALKATKSGAIRSNAGVVCVTDGADGACGSALPAAPGGVPACEHHRNDGRCGTTDVTPPTVKLDGLSWEKRYARSKAPRELRGVAANFPHGRRVADGSGLKDIRLRITRYQGKRCAYFDGDGERWRPMRSCETGKGRSFSTGATTADWSYQLPERLGKGRYRVEAWAIDNAGNTLRKRVKRENHFVFTVR